ncbi:flagellar assembly protein FliW [Paenibacillus sp. LHD-117]|uniref:flagellar assembly protein FliW n=1 Tax=Paenibacillus sp. LHD-117 TaxID=3071412 RepID=UPI0027E0FB95|nr:flagellar assembly protein FliW [Paenibacillus sp. LHD-117]MDQ6422503.1 flagellar assembly protein FliW [Paenibacillus sp. LHD-117]
MNTNIVRYQFEQGIPGFEHVKQFVFEEMGDELPMKLMKAEDDSEVSLLVASPFMFYPEYEWKLPDSVKEELEIESEADVEVWSVMTIPLDLVGATVNLLAPIILNTRTGKGKQLILHEHTYSSRAPIHRT